MWKYPKYRTYFWDRLFLSIVFIWLVFNHRYSSLCFLSLTRSSEVSLSSPHSFCSLIRSDVNTRNRSLQNWRIEIDSLRLSRGSASCAIFLTWTTNTFEPRGQKIGHNIELQYSNLVDSGVSREASASLPARSGWPAKTPSWIDCFLTLFSFFCLMAF